MSAILHYRTGIYSILRLGLLLDPYMQSKTDRASLSQPIRATNPYLDFEESSCLEVPFLASYLSLLQMIYATIPRLSYALLCMKLSVG